MSRNPNGQGGHSRTLDGVQAPALAAWFSTSRQNFSSSLPRTLSEGAGASLAPLPAPTALAETLAKLSESGLSRFGGEAQPEDGEPLPTPPGIRLLPGMVWTFFFLHYSSCAFYSLSLFFLFCPSPVGQL
ncbi:UNVERIFIED_CONTAM: hypothetical protein K2H54_030778 [Gekko kuhli]